MIVAEKELKIEGGYAPDLNMKMGEVNRQYILIPPFDISSYSVRSEIVKPDNTFVYTDQAINTDGNILLTLPEQAGAVAGYGHYIIKIYDLNTIVYSAVGNLRIDDHLILDGMIESVAEVNGYNFPDDFMMRGDLEGVFNDTTVSSETGWSSTKINNEIDALLDDTITSNNTGWTSSKIKNYVDQSALVNYSTNEHVVGKWIDGKPIYEQILHINSGWASEMHIPVTNLKYLLSFRGFGIASNNNTFPISNYYAQNTDKMFIYGEYNVGIMLEAGSAYYNNYGNVYLTIRYTKTTD